MKMFTVWTADFYNRTFQWFPKDDEVISQVEAPSVADLKQLFKDQGISPAQFRWELWKLG